MKQHKIRRIILSMYAVTFSVTMLTGFTSYAAENNISDIIPAVSLAEDEDGFVQAAVLFRDAGELSEGNIFVITQNSSTVITYGGPDDIYRYTDRCSLEIRGGDTVSYYVENYETGALVRFAFRCSELEDGTPHYETVDGPQ